MDNKDSKTMKDLQVDQILKGIYQACADAMKLFTPESMAQRIDRIILIGAHGTGKTTLANALSELTNTPVVESVAREFFKDWKYLEDCEMVNSKAGRVRTAETKQNILCSMSRWDFMRWVKADVPVIMTRCPLDTLAYGFADSLVSDNLMNTNLETLKESQEFCKAIEKSLFIYLPIEFAIEDDGVRPMDKMFQKKVDTCMRNLMYEFHITPLVVTGSVEERCHQVLVKIAGAEMANMLMDSYKEAHK